MMMAVVSTRVLRGSLAKAFDDSVTNSIALYAQLRREEDTALGVLTNIASGIKETHANGHGVENMQVSDSQRNSITESQTKWRYLIDLHDEVVLALGGTPTDTQIKDEMMGLLVPAYEAGPSTFCNLRALA
jgi:hypothetical protein